MINLFWQTNSKFFKIRITYIKFEHNIKFYICGIFILCSLKLLIYVLLLKCFSQIRNIIRKMNFRMVFFILFTMLSYLFHRRVKF